MLFRSRPSHADFTYQKKYGIRDYRGGGRSSARETAARVAAGAVAKMVLKTVGVSTYAFVSQVGHIQYKADYKTLNINNIESNDIRCPDDKIAAEMIDLIKKIKKEGDTIGGVVSCVANGVPVVLPSKTPLNTCTVSLSFRCVTIAD